LEAIFAFVSAGRAIFCPDHPWCYESAFTSIAGGQRYILIRCALQRPADPTARNSNTSSERASSSGSASRLRRFSKAASTSRVRPYALARLRGFAVRKRYFSPTGTRYQIDNPRRYLAATAENRCSEDLPYSHALIRVPTIVQREFELAQRHGNQPESSSARCSRSPCSADLSG
jgi:hypothetical protein